MGGPEGDQPIWMKEPVVLGDGSEIYALYWNHRIGEGKWMITLGLGENDPNIIRVDHYTLIDHGVLKIIKDGELVEVQTPEWAGDIVKYEKHFDERTGEEGLYGINDLGWVVIKYNESAGMFEKFDREDFAGGGKVLLHTVDEVATMMRNFDIQSAGEIFRKYPLVNNNEAFNAGGIFQGEGGSGSLYIYALPIGRIHINVGLENESFHFIA